MSADWKHYCLAGIVLSLGLSSANASANPEDSRRARFIVQDADTLSAARDVTRVGGTALRQLDIINTVAAGLSAGANAVG